MPTIRLINNSNKFTPAHEIKIKKAINLAFPNYKVY